MNKNDDLLPNIYYVPTKETIIKIMHNNSFDVRCCVNFSMALLGA